MTRSYRVLSIDAWRDGDGWTWNNWFHVGDVETIPKAPRAFLRMMRDEGYLTNKSKGRVAVEDDGHNIVVIDRKSFEPLFAVEVGED